VDLMASHCTATGVTCERGDGSGGRTYIVIVTEWVAQLVNTSQRPSPGSPGGSLCKAQPDPASCSGPQGQVVRTTWWKGSVDVAHSSTFQAF